MNPIAPLNTAIFWDIENLIGGYGFNQSRPDALSLGDIFKSVQEAPGVGGIAVQRAYANWSDSRLATLRTELNELGIEPVQVFGFSSHDQKKNAADIQLVIDALELVHLRPAISTYVVVSGDGGFSALVRILHQHSRYVVCAAYADSANATLKAICDHFVPQKKPAKAGANGNGNGAVQTPPKMAASPVANVPYTQGLTQLPVRATQAEILAAVRQVLEQVKRDREAAKQLKGDGIDVAAIKPALAWLFEKITSEKALARCGASQIGRLILAVTDDAVFVAKPASGGVSRLFTAEAALGERWTRIAVPKLDPHSLESYRGVLAVDRVKPVIRMADKPADTVRALQRFCQSQLRGLLYSEVLAKIAEGDTTTSGAIPMAQLKKVSETLLDMGLVTLSGKDDAVRYEGPKPGDWMALLEILRDSATKKLQLMLDQTPYSFTIHELLPDGMEELALPQGEAAFQIWPTRAEAATE